MKKNELEIFDLKKEKGIVVYSFSACSKPATTEEDVADITDAILDNDASVIFSVRSADQGNELISLCRKIRKEPIVLNAPKETTDKSIIDESSMDESSMDISSEDNKSVSASLRAFLSDRWAVASLAYLTVCFLAISAWGYTKLAPR